MSTTPTPAHLSKLWKAWPFAACLALLIGAIALFNTGDQSPWGIEWVILPIALVPLTLIDLIPRTLLKRVTGDDFVLPRAFTALLWVHWAAPLAITIPAVLWKLDVHSAQALTPMMLGVYLVSGVALTVSAAVLRRRTAPHSPERV